MGTKLRAPPRVDVVEELQEPSYSVRLIKPFLRLLRRVGRTPTDVLESFEQMDLERRLPISDVHELLASAISRLEEPDLGLKASREYARGDCGALDYAISSAATLRDALETAGRYMRLVNDGLDFRLEIKGDRAIARFDNAVAMPRAAMDFQLGAFFRAQHQSWPPNLAYEISFAHPAPNDTTEYDRTFGTAKINFTAPFAGFSFDRDSLDAKLQSSDAKLHDVLRRHVELMLDELPRTRTLADQVRDIIARELASGNPSILRAAEHLRVSSRTLERRLEREGTTFSALLDELRRRLALGYVTEATLDLSEVALLLGFSQTSAFHRAFKRWTGQTPLHYRRGQVELR